MELAAPSSSHPGATPTLPDWARRAAFWSSKARVGRLVPALALAGPLLLGAGFGIGVVAGSPGGIGALVHADVSWRSSARGNWEAVKQALRAPDGGSATLAVASKALWIAGDFSAAMAPPGMAPQSVEVHARHVETGALGASMTRPDQEGLPHELRVDTNSKGAWPLSDVGVGAGMEGKADKAVAAFVVGHEMGHALFVPASRSPDETAPERRIRKTEAALMLGGVGTERARAATSDASWAERSMPFGVAAMDESFSDGMAIAYLAKRLDREDFDDLFDGILAERRLEFLSLLDRLDAMGDSEKAGRSGPIDQQGSGAKTAWPSRPDPHMTYPALLAMRERGYDALRALSPEQAVEASMESARLGLFATFHVGRAGLAPLLRARASEPSIQALQDAGEGVWRRGEQTQRWLDDERAARQSAKIKPSPSSTEPREGLSLVARKLAEGRLAKAPAPSAAPAGPRPPSF